MISRSSGVPLYRAIADELHQQIQAGRWKPGQPIPSIKTIAVEREVNWHTAARAVHLLAQRGAVTIGRGDHTRVRETQVVADIDIPPGCAVTARMPTDLERDQLGIPDGVPLIALLEQEPGGGWLEVDQWPADRARLRRPDGPDTPSGQSGQ